MNEMNEIDLDKIINDNLGTFIVRTDNPQNCWTARLKDYINNEENDDTAITGTAIGNYDIDISDGMLEKYVNDNNRYFINYFYYLGFSYYVRKK